MNYKRILTEETAKELRKEGIDFALISLFKNRDLVRDIEVEFNDSEEKFYIGAKTVRMETLMEDHFCSTIIDGEKWYPFNSTYIMRERKPEKTLGEVVNYFRNINIEVSLSELKWRFVIEH